ncbi:MAG: hypothetical protein QNJ97_22470 [Myxococcota bacterium]|nr:hypothetical protein [Myxococcota bacterium]
MAWISIPTLEQIRQVIRVASLRDRSTLFLSLTLFLIPAAARGGLETGQPLTTFDPYGDGQVEVVQETAAVDDLVPMWTLVAGYTFTHRKDLIAVNPENGSEYVIRNGIEQQHLWRFGVDFRPLSLLFVGASLPVMRSSFERYSTVLFEATGLGDVATYVGTELPWFPLTLTAMLMWPTGDFEKGMGTGEFSGGLLADLRWQLGIVDTKLSGFYFLVKDPKPRDDPEVSVQKLPNTYGASISAGIQVLPWLRTRVGFDWSYSTLITGHSVHVFKPSVWITWRLISRLHAVTGYGIEVSPTQAHIPSIALISSF